MRKHFFAALVFVAAWALAVPQSSAQTITPIAIPPSGSYAGAGTLSPASYRGNAAASNLGTPSRGGGSWNNHEQNWYSVSLVAGLTYTFTEAMSGDPNDNAVLSLQSSSGVQVAFYRSTQPSGTMHYTPTVSGTYTLIISRNDNVRMTSPYTLTISVPATTTTTAIAAPPINYPMAGSVRVTVSDAVATPIGPVTLSVDGGPGITQNLSGGSASFNLPGLSVGNHTLRASYPAQPGFAASSATGTLSVYPTATTTTINAPPVTYPFNASVTVTVNDPAATPTGSVTLRVDGGAGITQPLSGGSTTFTLPGLAIGSHGLSASYNPQTGFTASSSTSSVVVNSPPNLSIPVSQSGSLSSSSYRGPAASTAQSGSQDPWNPSANYQNWYTVTLIAGMTYTISVDTTGDSFLSLQDASGTQVAWNDDAGLSSLGSPLASQIVYTPTTSGVYTVIVSTGAMNAGGTLNYTLTIPTPTAPVSTTTSISGNTGTTQTANVTITVTAAAGTPTGNVTLSLDGGAGASQPLVNGTATFTFHNLTAGIHTVNATYPGASGFLPSSSSGSLFIGIPNVKAAPQRRPGDMPIRYASLEAPRPRG